VSAQSIVKRIVRAQASLDSLYEEVRVLQAEISVIAVFGDFSVEDLLDVQREGKRIIQFFSLKSSKAKDSAFPEEMIYVGTEYDLDYFVAINKEKKQYPGFIEIHIKQPVGKLKAKVSSLKEQIALLEKELKQYTAYTRVLLQKLTEHMNLFHKETVEKIASLHLGERIFALEAWIPKNKIDTVQEMMQPFSIAIEKITVEKEDRLPTYMENKGYAKVGEDLVNIYDVPAPCDKDPSSWVMWAFAIFFGMIIADAGYGCLYLGLACFLTWKFPKLTGQKKRLLKLLFALSGACILWGGMIASYFGIQLDINSPLRKFSCIHMLAVKKADYHLVQRDTTFREWLETYPALNKAKNGAEVLSLGVKKIDGRLSYEVMNTCYDAILMEFAILAGIVHISLSFLRMLLRNFSGIGWVLFIVGGYLYFPSILQATSIIHYLGIISKTWAFYWGKWILYSGLILAPVIAIIQKRLSGVLEIMNVIQIFADILSYLRLYALALASMIMVSTFNAMGVSLGIIGILVILCGHAMNIVLGLMGGVIHGLRLNFLEWYHYCFEGGGKKFNPLRLLKIK
jgi:V/A-type H+-transporting ATPase subunit I